MTPALRGSRTYAFSTAFSVSSRRVGIQSRGASSPEGDSFLRGGCPSGAELGPEAARHSASTFDPERSQGAQFRIGVDSPHQVLQSPSVACISCPAALFPIAGIRSTAEACGGIMPLISIARPMISYGNEPIGDNLRKQYLQARTEPP
jgi:hypothetical protein